MGTPRGPISVSWRASGAASIRFELNATVPVGSTSRISAPVPEGIDAAKVILTNDGKTFFCHRSFVKGAVEGILSAQFAANEKTIEVVTGGGLQLRAEVDGVLMLVPCPYARTVSCFFLQFGI